MTEESTETSTDAESPKLIELRNDILSSSVQTLTNDGATYEFDPLIRDSIKKKPTWLSTDANQMLNDYLDELNLQPNDIVTIEDTVRLIMARSAVSSCFRQFGTYIVIDREIVTGSDLKVLDYEIMKKQQHEIEHYRNYIKKFNKVYRYKLKRVGESYTVALKNVFLTIEDNKVKLSEPTIESRFTEVGKRSPLPNFIEIDSFSALNDIYFFLGMKKQ